MGEDGLIKRAEKATEHQANAEVSDNEALSEYDKIIANVIVGISESKGDESDEVSVVKYSYNGVVLPKLPDWDKEKYPYATITCYHAETDIYQLCLIDYPWEFDFDSSGVGGLVSSQLGNAYRRYYSYVGGQEWEIGESGVCESYASTAIPIPMFDFIWTNQNIYNEEDGSLYASASDPVPVYE